MTLCEPMESVEIVIETGAPENATGAPRFTVLLSARTSLNVMVPPGVAPVGCITDAVNVTDVPKMTDALLVVRLVVVRAASAAPMVTITVLENSEVLPELSVAVAVTYPWPPGTGVTVAVKVPLPFASVVTDTLPR